MEMYLGLMSFINLQNQPTLSQSLELKPMLPPNPDLISEELNGQMAEKMMSQHGGAYTHMTLLAQNNQGLSNLFKLSSLASLEGFYYKPRVDRELLSKYSAGLIGTTGCAGGEIQTRLRMGAYEEAKKAASEMKDIFGA